MGRAELLFLFFGDRKQANLIRGAGNRHIEVAYSSLKTTKWLFAFERTGIPIVWRTAPLRDRIT